MKNRKNSTISSLAKSRIRHCKSRSILTGAAIFLTAALLAGLVTSAIGIFDVTRQQALAEGNHHAAIRHLTAGQVEMLHNHFDVESLEAIVQFATVSYDNMDGYLTAGATLKEGIYNGIGNLTKGRFPENPDEICGPPAFLSAWAQSPSSAKKSPSLSV